MGTAPVSYTHLDVYKRQHQDSNDILTAEAGKDWIQFMTDTDNNDVINTVVDKKI